MSALPDPAVTAQLQDRVARGVKILKDPYLNRDQRAKVLDVLDEAEDALSVHQTGQHKDNFSANCPENVRGLLRCQAALERKNSQLPNGGRAR
jgi:hypothetical protein